MKKLMCLLTAMVMTLSLAACSDNGDSSKGNSSKGDISSNSSSAADTSSLADSSSQDDSSSKTDSSSKNDSSSKDDSSSKPSGGTVIDPSGVTDVNEDITEKIIAMLNAAAVKDQNTYIELSDVEYLEKAYPYDYIDDIGEQAADDFEDCSEYLGGFTGEIKIVFCEKVNDMIKAEADKELICDIYGIILIAKCPVTDVCIEAMAFDKGGSWAVTLSPSGEIEHAYYDFEDMINEQLQAAADGNKDKYMELANSDLYLECAKAAWRDEYGEEFAADEIQELKDMFNELTQDSYDELHELLADRYKNSYVFVEEFPIETQYGDVTSYGRIVLAVFDMQGGYDEVEGYAYTDGTKRGIWLMPD